MPRACCKTHAFTVLLGLTCVTNVDANSYGIYDARALGMAGTAVGVGDLSQAHHYNPSLIAFHKGHEDRTQDGRHSIALIAGNLSAGARAASEAISDDLEGRLSRAIDQLNDVPNPAAANRGITAAQDLERAMYKLKEKDIDADGYVGYSVTLPADREGGAFFIGSRLIGAGDSTIEESDFELLDDYLEALQYIATEGAEGEQHPELFNEENRLYDPSSRILSSASGTAIAQFEVGVSAAKQWTLWGIPVAMGLAPKLVQLHSYGESWRVVEGDFDSDSFDARDTYFNMDAGVTAQFNEHYRVALAVKDVRQRSFTAAAGRRVRLQPRARLGLAYVHPKVSVGLDVDLLKNNNLHTLVQQQVVSAGIEYQPVQPLKLRLGYQHDLADWGNDRIAAGIGWQLARFGAEVAYTNGRSGSGAALQLSFYH